MNTNDPSIARAIGWRTERRLKDEVEKMTRIQDGHIPVAVRCDCTPGYAEVSKRCPLFCLAEINEVHLCTIGTMSKRCDNCKGEMRVIATKLLGGVSDYRIAADVREAIAAAREERKSGRG